MYDTSDLRRDAFFLFLLQTDPQDPFNQFWNKLEQMLENLSQPVAFATIPLTQSLDATQQEEAAAALNVEENILNTEDIQKPQTIGEEEQKELEDRLALALDDDEELISGKYSICIGYIDLIFETQSSGWKSRST